jgi:hypothetical protein
MAPPFGFHVYLPLGCKQEDDAALDGSEVLRFNHDFAVEYKGARRSSSPPFCAAGIRHLQGKPPRDVRPPEAGPVSRSHQQGGLA